MGKWRYRAVERLNGIEVGRWKGGEMEWWPVEKKDKKERQ